MSEEPNPTEGEVLLYTTPNAGARVEVYYQAETFWLTLNRMAELFGSSKQAISYHLQNIFASNELRRESTVKEILTVQPEGGRSSSSTNTRSGRVQLRSRMRLPRRSPRANTRNSASAAIGSM